MVKRYTVNGFTGSLQEIAERFNIKYSTLYKQLRCGMSLEEVVNKPVKQNLECNKVYSVYGFIGTLLEIAEHFNIKYATLKTRLRQGMSLEDAVLAKKYNGGKQK